MLQRPQNQRLRAMRWIGCACLSALFFSLAYLPIDTPLSHGSISAAVVVHKDIRLQQIAKTGWLQDSPLETWIDDSGLRFVKVDRKQNLRLWPVIYTGLTRSPPPINLV